MKRYTTLFLTVVAIQFVSLQTFAQSIQVPGPSEEVVRRQAMESALDAWRKTDSGLERALFQKQSEEMLKRIAASAESRNKVEDARLAYIQALLKQAQHQLSTLQSLTTGSASLPVDDIRTNIETRLDSLTAEEVYLRRLLKERDPSVSTERQMLINEELGEQLKQVANLRENLYQQKELLETIRQGEEKRRGVAQALLDHQRELLQLLDSESDRTTEERSLWESYYAALSKLVTKHAGSKEGVLHGSLKSADPKRTGAKP